MTERERLLQEIESMQDALWSTAQVLETVCHMLDRERQRRKELEALLVAEDEPTQAEQQEPLHSVEE